MCRAMCFSRRITSSSPAQQVNVYTDLSVATARLDREIAAKPDDPEPRLRYAEVLFAAQQLNGPSGALTKLDEAAALMGLTRATTEPAANAVAFSGFRASCSTTRSISP